MVGETSSRVPAAADLARALAEARAIADGVGQTLATTHVLFALYTVPNPAEVLLLEHDVHEDKLIALMQPGARESAQTLREVLLVAEETALRCDARHTNTLHLLIALLKSRDCAAHALLERALGNVSPFRNRVMSFVTGALPRRLLQPLHEAKALSTKLEAARPPKVERPLCQKAGDDRVSNASREALPERASTARLEPQDDGEDVDDDVAEGPTARRAAPAKRTAPAPAPKEPSLAPTMPPTSFDLDPARYPWLSSLGRNLTALAASGGLDPAIGRAAELEQLIDILGKRRANNPCLVGEPGVGKTAIVEGLAVKLMRGDVDVSPLHGKLIIELDMGRIVAGTALRGSFSERMQGLKKDVQRAKGSVIVFVDEIHTLMGAGGSGDGPQDAANELKAALARGDFPCIGSTTLDEYRRYIEQDPALDRRFVKILVEEPDDDEAIAILRGATPLYERHHKVKAEDDAVCAAVQLSSRFLHERRLPSKAIDLIDLTLSRARRAGGKRVSRSDVARVCADVAKIPLERVLLEDASRFLEMERSLQERVVGHADIIARIAHTLRRNYAGFSSHRPMGSFLFLGPSGVGKTELAKALADFIFGTESALVRLDMSEYSEPHTVARITGAPPGYVGHADGGQLTEALRRRPHAVVLLDEIEKAHPDVLPLLLQILDEGRLTDGRGRTVTFRHAVVILTTNLGADALTSKSRPVGFMTRTLAPQALEDKALESARKSFAPELWGRIDDKLVFRALAKEELERIASLLLRASSRALETARSIRFRFGADVLSFLVEAGGIDATTGARPMRQAIQRLVETPVSEAILRGDAREGDDVHLSVRDGRIAVRAARPTAAA